MRCGTFSGTMSPKFAMKSFPLSVLLACAALGLPTFAARALDPSRFNDGFAPLTPALTRFYLDLEAIPAGSVVTDAQHQTLVADLAALPPGPETPSAADLDQLATDFGSLAVAGLVTDDLEYELAMDFDVDYDDPDPWLPYVQGDVQFALNPPPPYDPNDPGNLDPVILETAVPTAVLLRPTRQVMHFSASLTATDGNGAWQPGAYGGSVRLTNLIVNGTVPVPSLKLSTTGLGLGEAYTVAVVRRSDGVSVPLGRFRAHGSSVTSEGFLPSPPRDTHSAVTFGGRAKRRLPDGFSVNDVASILVSNAGGQVLLSHDFSAEASQEKQVHRVRLALSGTSVGKPPPKGTVLAVSKLDAGAAGVRRNKFLFLARHLPANALVTLTLDQTVLGQYTTTSDGHLLVAQNTDPRNIKLGAGKSLAVNGIATDSDWSSLRSITLTDAQGDILLSGSL